MAELNELFEQILHSERNFKERTSRLRELSSKIQQCQLELQQTKEASHTLQGEQVVKRLKLAGLEVNAKLLAIRRGITQEQKDKMAGGRKQVIDELEAAEKEFDTQQETFRDDLVEFGRGYDLHGSGCKHREEQAQRKLNVLQDELILLEAELVEMESQKEEVRKLEEQLAKARAQLQQERVKEKELQKVTVEQEAEVRQLEEGKGGLTAKLSRDPEFVRLQHELEACRGCPEELACQALTRDLEELQRQCYHKNMKQQLSLRRRGCSSRDSGGSGGDGGGGAKEKCGATSLHQRAGHYNPYICQYVPAPGACETGAGSSFTVQMSSELSREEGEGLNPSQGSVDSAEGVSLVDDEWLEDDQDDQDGDQGNGCTVSSDVQDWDMELDESELALLENDINLTPGGSEANPVGYNQGDEDSSCYRRKGHGKVATTASLSSFREQSWSERTGRVARLQTTRAENSTHPQTTSTADTGLLQTVNQHRRSNPPHQMNHARRRTQSLFGFSHRPTTRGPTPKPDATRRPPVPQPDATSSNSTTLSARGESSTKRQISESSSVKIPAKSRGLHSSGGSSKNPDFSVSATDSPVPGCAARKRPGQSIYKAPGQQQHDIRCLPKSAKKVRFHY